MNNDLGNSFSNLILLSPVVTVILGAFLVLLIQCFSKKDLHFYLQIISIISIITSSYLAMLLWENNNTPIFNASFVLDKYSIVFYTIFNIIALLTILNSGTYLDRMNLAKGEYYSLLLFSVSGMYLMASSTNLLSIFIALEIMSLSIYVLTGMIQKNNLSNEAAMKYFLLGGFASGLFIFGSALIYGTTGSIQLSSIAKTVADFPVNVNLIGITGFGLIISGFCFKVAAVPFQMWTPDVYEGAPTPITGFMATAVKAAAFASFLRVLTLSFIDLNATWMDTLWIISVLTMFVGNLTALVQKNVKRMLAYSSIAHAGYLLIALCVVSKQLEDLGTSSLLFYLLAYAFMTIGAFSVLIALEEKAGEGLELTHFSGLSRTQPFLAFAMSVFMLSLTGIPFTAGFMGKFYIFTAAINSKFYGLVILAVINSALSAYYYLKVIVAMYMQENTNSTKVFIHAPLFIVLIITLLGTFWLGVFPSDTFEIMKAAVGG